MFTDKKLLERLDKMLEDGINGTFEESDYDETKLSKLESKWLRYLTSSKLSYQKIEQEREKLKELVSDISHQTKTPLGIFASGVFVWRVMYETSSFSC